MIWILNLCGAAGSVALFCHLFSAIYRGEWSHALAFALAFLVVYRLFSLLPNPS